MMAGILRSLERINEICPVEAAWDLKPIDKLYVCSVVDHFYSHSYISKHKIEEYTADVLFCPELAVYYGKPVLSIVMKILEQHPSWGLR